MRKPSDSQLLEIWERGYGRRPSEQALVMLAACDSCAAPADLLRLSVGERDQRLLQLRQLLFGERAALTSRCPACSERLEFAFSIGELLLERGSHLESLSIADGAWRVGFRVPSAGDLIAVGQIAPGERRRALLVRCIGAIEHEVHEEPSSIDHLPPALVKAVVDAMANADPQANVEFDLRCSECEHPWMASFDIASFLWREINDWAHRLLMQIHALAKAYGWTQGEILRLSSWRRQVYLGMARQ